MLRFLRKLRGFDCRVRAKTVRTEADRADLAGHRTDITSHCCVINSPAEALGGKRFNEEGLLVPPNKGILELRKELLALKGNDFWSRFGRWFFVRGPERTISPDSKITASDVHQLSTEATEARPTDE